MRFCRFFIMLSIIISIFGFCLSETWADSKIEEYDTIIKNGKILNGTGNPWFYGEVGIKDGKIVKIGDLENCKSKKIINAEGMIVAPGFIDVHTHTDNQIFNLQHADNFIRDGVTTVVTGNCGGSVRNVKKYLEKIEKEKIAINTATLVGHNSVLTEVKGDVATPLTADQIEECKVLLRNAMFDGAFGMSTGLEYTPGQYSNTDEIIELQKSVSELGGLYASHMRNEDITIIPAIEEALRIGREAGCPVEISHFKIARDSLEGGIDIPLKMVNDARKEGIEVWLDQYPYTASRTGISLLLPDWIFEDGDDKAREILSAPDQIKKVISDMIAYHHDKRHRNDFSFAYIAACKSKPEYEGKNIKEITRILKSRKMGREVELSFISMADECRTITDIYLEGGASCVYHVMDEEDVVKIMKSPLVSVCSDSGVRKLGEGKPHPRGYGSRARVLGKYVREMNVLTLEEAVRKMTSLPASAFKFKDRGLIHENYWADITIFNPDTVIDKATFENAHQYSEGIEYVMVNGELVVDNGEITNNLPGKPIYGPAFVK